MNEISLPPLSHPEIISREVCYTVRLYLAIWSDLNDEQRELVMQHLRICAACMGEHYLYENVSHAMTALPVSAPSARVDQAVLAAIAARSRSSSQPAHPAMRPLRPQPLPRTLRAPAASKRGPLRVGGLIAAAAVIVCALFAVLYFTRESNSPQRAFLLPASVTWTGYVLYEVQNGVDKQGQKYSVTTYYNTSNKAMNVETVMGNSLDVVMVSDAHDALGLDMMHHVAQWNANNWAVDESMFNLNELKYELQSNTANYMGMMMFNGQQVYRVHCANNLTMLLGKDYMPVNVLNSNNTPIYQTFRLLLPTQVPNSMWNMSVPSGFQMGTLPAKP